MKSSATNFFVYSAPHGKSIAQWRAFVDWELHQRRPYVVVDPVDQNGLLYLSEREYQAMVRTCLSTQDTLLVVLRPGMTRDDFVVVNEGGDTVDPSSNENNSPSTLR